MSSEFPEFDEPIAIDARRSWTARFDSYDQRQEDCYYAVALHQDGREVARFMAEVSLHWAGDDWSAAEFVERLRQELQDVAVQGKTNTTYQGSLAGWLADPKP